MPAGGFRSTTPEHSEVLRGPRLSAVGYRPEQRDAGLFQLYALLVWPDVFSDGEVLLSLKVQSKEGSWKERLISPESLRKYVTTVPIESVLGALPPSWQAMPGRFYSLMGEGPFAAHALVNLPKTTQALRDTPPGAVAVRWTGGLRGL